MKTFMIVAVTVDGFIGRDSNHEANWTGKADKQLFVKLTKEAGVIIEGFNTFRTIGRALSDRRNIVYTTDPQNLTVDGIEPTNEEPTELLNRLESEGESSIAICGGASIYNLFMERGLVDEIYLTIIPKVFGRGINLFSSELDAGLELIESRNLDDGAVLLHYRVVKH